MHPFVMKSLFVYNAKSQGWTDEEVQKLLKELVRESAENIWVNFTSL